MESRRPDNDSATRFPVVLVTGLRSAGKTALVSHLHGRRHRLAVLTQHAEQPEDIALRARALADTRAHDGLIVELSPLTDAAAVAAALETSGPVYLDTLVTVVDAPRLLADFCSRELLAERCGLPASGDDERLLADALTDQVELASVIALNKTDCIDRDTRRGLVDLLRALNPVAVLIECEQGRIAGRELLGAHRFSLERAHACTGWAKALADEPIPNAQQHRIGAFVYRERRPFHPERLSEFFRTSWPGVVRSKGMFWIATRPDWAAELSQAGAARRYRAVTSWWAATLEGKTFEPGEVEAFLGIPWDPVFGDRRQEIAFVGLDLDESALRASVDACLLNDDEMRRGPEVWQTFRDPFPPWGLVATVRRASKYN